MCNALSSFLVSSFLMRTHTLLLWHCLKLNESSQHHHFFVELIKNKRTRPPPHHPSLFFLSVLTLRFRCLLRSAPTLSQSPALSSACVVGWFIVEDEASVFWNPSFVSQAGGCPSRSHSHFSATATIFFAFRSSHTRTHTLSHYGFRRAPPWLRHAPHSHTPLSGIPGHRSLSFRQHTLHRVCV